MKPVPLCALLATSLLLGACASSPHGPAKAAAATPPATAPATSPVPFLERSLRLDKVLLGPQPGAEDFATVRARGITRVISLRTPEETAALGFDPAAAAASVGLDYQVLPVPSNGGFNPAVLDAFSAEMAKGGELLLHCGTGARAGQLYAAWLVRERGLSPQEAMQRVAPLGLWPLPMERLLGRPLTIGFAAPASGDAPRP